MERIPFKIIIDNEEFVDLDLEQSKLITKMKNSKNRYEFKDIIIFEDGGLSVIYVDDGGIAVCN